MKCSKCNCELVLTPRSMCLSKEKRKEDFCRLCKTRYSEEDLQKIKEAELIEEDMEAWRAGQKFR